MGKPVEKEADRAIAEAIVTCPSCGGAISSEVRIAVVEQTKWRLNVKFAGTSIEHECHGRK